MDDFKETSTCTAKNGANFSITIDKIDASRDARIRQFAIEKLEQRVLYEDLSQLDEWSLHSWCEKNDFEKTTFLCPKCHGFGPVNVRIVIERRTRVYLFGAIENDEEVNIYHCENCKSDYKQDQLDIERGSVNLSNENKFIGWLVRLEKITVEQACERQRRLMQ